MTAGDDDHPAPDDVGRPLMSARETTTTRPPTTPEGRWYTQGTTTARPALKTKGR